MIHLAEEEISGQENILSGAEKAAAIVKESTVSEEHPVLHWDNSQGVSRAKPYPTRAAQVKIQTHLKERHLPWRYFKVLIPFAFSLIQNKASLAPAIASAIQTRERKKKDITKEGWHLCEEVKHLKNHLKAAASLCLGRFLLGYSATPCLMRSPITLQCCQQGTGLAILCTSDLYTFISVLVAESKAN